mmetsp:Transcript_40838/g.65645  ORF Transcript_40838/g.65645 Transcript_40838/m.65645 type:complete len:228 (-) Transcript_40838:168-851(-)
MLPSFEPPHIFGLLLLCIYGSLLKLPVMKHAADIVLDGVRIRSVVAGSTADKAGLKKGMIIQEIEGKVLDLKMSGTKVHAILNDALAWAIKKECDDILRIKVHDTDWGGCSSSSQTVVLPPHLFKLKGGGGKREAVVSSTADTSSTSCSSPGIIATTSVPASTTTMTKMTTTTTKTTMSTMNSYVVSPTMNSFSQSYSSCSEIKSSPHQSTTNGAIVGKGSLQKDHR